MPGGSGSRQTHGGVPRIMHGCMAIINKGRLLLIGICFLLFCLLSTSSFAQISDVQTKPPIRINGQVQSSAAGITPAQIRRAYGFDQITNQGAGQTIAIVDAYDNPFIEQDLAVFSQTFDFPPCTIDSGCLQTIYAASHPGVNPIWALEISL